MSQHIELMTWDQQFGVPTAKNGKYTKSHADIRQFLVSYRGKGLFLVHKRWKVFSILVALVEQDVSLIFRVVGIFR
jgi:hypothetical protein